MREIALDGRQPLTDRLEQYGFRKTDGGYFYETDILDGQFRFRAKVSPEGKLFAEVIDVCTEEPYTLHLAEDVTGSFVGSVRAAYNGVISDITDRCFERSVFREKTVWELIDYVRARYGDELEFLWAKSPKNAVWRRKDNQKWYAAVLTVPRNRLGLSGDGEIDIVDLRMKTEDIASAVDRVTVFPGYHMNKSHWITVLLDGSTESEALYALIDESYRLAKGR